MEDFTKLRKSISEMSDEELLEIVRGSRAARRETPGKKREQAVAKKAEATGQKALKDLSGLLASLSEEDRLAIISQLENDEEDLDDSEE